MSVLLRRRGISAHRGATPVLPAAIAAWNFSEGAGVMSADMTGNGHTINVHSFGPGHTGEGAVGTDTAPSAAWSDSTILTAPSELTAMFWVNPVTVSGTPDILTLEDSSGTTAAGAYWTDSTHIVMYVITTSGEVDGSSVVIPVGSWTHIAIAVGSGTATMYFGGVSVSTVSYTGTFNDLQGPYIGGKSTAAEGTYSDPRIFDTALTSATITAYMNTPVEFTGAISTVATVVSWAANEGTGTSVADSSGNGHTGIAASDGWVAGHGTHTYAASGDGSAPGVGLVVDGLMSNPTAVTLMCWVKPINLTGTGDLLEIKNGSNTYLSIFRPGDSSLVAEVSTDNGNWFDTTTYDTNSDLVGAWHHIAATWDSTGKLTLYLMGMEVGSADAHSTGVTLGDIVHMYAGGTDTKPNQGAVNDVRLFDSALSASDVLYFRETPI